MDFDYFYGRGADQFDYVVTVVVPRMSHYKLMELYSKKSGILHGLRLLNKKECCISAKCKLTLKSRNIIIVP